MVVDPEVRHVIGKACFIDDLVLPKMLTCNFVRSTYPHAKIRNIATSNFPRYAKVFTWKEVKNHAGPLQITFPFPDCNSIYLNLLADDVVRYVGEPIAAVLADDYYQALDASDNIDVDYEPLDPVVNVFRHDILLYPEWGSNIMVRFSRKFGDVEQALDASPIVVEEKVSTHRLTAAPIENRGCVASYDPGLGFLTVWSPNQNPHMHRTVLSQSLDLPESKIRVIAPDIGGGFGQKGHTYREEIVVCALSMLTGRPVKWIESRRENLVASAHSREQFHHVRIAAKRDGTITALIDEAILDVGAYPLIPHSYLELAHVLIDVLPGPYRINNYSVDVKLAVTNKCPSGAYRGFGHPEATFVRERVIDLLAEECGVDPITIRLRNLISPDDLPFIGPTGMVFDSGDPRKTLEQLKEKTSKIHGEKTHDGKVVGVGYAVGVKGSVPTMFGATRKWGSSEAAAVKLNMDGRVTVYSGAVSMGTRLEKLLRKIVSERMGINPASVDVVFGDTSLTPYSTGLWGSRGAVMCGGAAAAAASKLVDKIKNLAATLFECSPKDIVVEDGKVFVVDSPHRALTLSELAWKAYNQPNAFPAEADVSLDAVGFYDPPNISAESDEFGRMNASAAVSTIAAAAEVEMDTETYAVKIRKMILVENGGNYLSKEDVDDQIIGGAVQGLSGAVCEEFTYSHDGFPLTTTFADYLLVTPVEIPAIEIMHLVSPSPYTFSGAKGLGETGTIPVNAAVVNAIADAFRKIGLHAKLNRSTVFPYDLWRYAKP